MYWTPFASVVVFDLDVFQAEWAGFAHHVGHLGDLLDEIARLDLLVCEADLAANDECTPDTG